MVFSLGSIEPIATTEAQCKDARAVRPGSGWWPRMRPGSLPEREEESTNQAWGMGARCLGLRKGSWSSAKAVVGSASRPPS